LETTAFPVQKTYEVTNGGKAGCRRTPASATGDQIKGERSELPLIARQLQRSLYDKRAIAAYDGMSILTYANNDIS